MKIYIDYDNNELANLSKQLYQLFKENSYDVTLLDNNLTLAQKINQIKNTSNSFILSNKINNSNTIEIIYPLRNNNTLAINLFNNLSNVTNTSKYYQLRSPTNTNLDYYEILRNINNNDAILIKYGDITNNNLANTIFNSINSYLNNKNIYLVKSGDSLYAIAKKFNTTVDEIKRLNNLSNNNLSIGQKIIIPYTNNTSNDNTNNIYLVKSGDSLYAIAKKFNTTVDEIKRLNNLTSNLLSINQKLIIPSNNSDITYIVQKGDSLYAIAKKYNTSVDKIKKDNNISNNLLSIGQKLIIKK